MTWQDTAKRLAAHERFEWMDGMKPVCRTGGCGVKTGEEERATGAETSCFSVDHHPDLTDWPTIGALVGMLMDGDSKKYPENDGFLSFDRVTTRIKSEWLEQYDDVTVGEAVALALLEVWDA
jgi:hypothetical protein